MPGAEPRQSPTYDAVNTISRKKVLCDVLNTILPRCSHSLAALVFHDPAARQFDGITSMCADFCGLVAHACLHRLYASVPGGASKNVNSRKEPKDCEDSDQERIRSHIELPDRFVNIVKTRLKSEQVIHNAPTEASDYQQYLASDA